ncbi:hypothetical protein NMY22_g14838 [Coprinellus aureogranulatus]|nr:hypothetical protein NMY22_g14838 [Coprinellus aureogranulatus]
MTTLRSFQHEIEEIHNREVTRQRATTTISEKDKEKENAKVMKGKVKVGAESTTTKKEQPDVETDALPVGSTDEDDDQILNLLLSKEPADHDAVRDRIAALLTRHNGEYVIRIGEQPPREDLFSGELTDETAGWKGTARSAQEIKTLVQELTKTVEEVGGRALVLFDVKSGHPRTSILLRLPPPNVSLTPEVRCAVVGNVDSGKSTTLGVLTRGMLDDGRGKARVGLFRHKHELETGRTSSVGMEILGFAPSGQPILPNTSHTADPDTIRREKLGWEEISLQAAKIVSFIDLAGHEKYLKTTLYGLTSGAPSCVILIVGANAGLIGMSKEHLAIALALSVPVVVCITKIDMTPPNVLAETIKQVVKILKSPGCRKTPVFVKSVETAVEISTSFGSDRICPIFQLSNVTGLGLDFLRTFLNLLPSSEGDKEKFAVDQPFEYSITEVWSVPYVGTVVNGIINSGVVKAGDTVMLGPDSNGNYTTTMIKSMQRKRANVNTAEAGQCVSFALKRIRRAAVRKGMVLVHKSDIAPRAVKQFEGQVLILYHNTTLQKNYQAMLHCGAVRQTVRIIGMDHPQGVLRTGDRATVQFEFISHPEFVKEGMKLLFRTRRDNAASIVIRQPRGPDICTLFAGYRTVSQSIQSRSPVPKIRSFAMVARKPVPPLPPRLSQRDSDLWSEYSSLDSTARYPANTLTTLASVAEGGKDGRRLIFSFDPLDFPVLAAGGPDSDEELNEKGGHLEKGRRLKKKREPHSYHDWNLWSHRGFSNILSLFILVGGVLALFIAYPIVTYVQRRPTSFLGGYNIGGINASGQVPIIRGNYGLIDDETPTSAYTKPSWHDPSQQMRLVFSDEFNTDGRTFYPGDDPYWEAVDLHYWATGNLEWYDPEAVMTEGGALVITLSDKQTHGMNYEGGMLASWNKFCFTGGYIEASVTMPGPNNVVGLWPAIWTMGNLGRAGYGATLEGVWPYTYDTCDVGTAPNQTINDAPLAATEDGAGPGGALSFLPGQKLSRCTCAGEDHPGPRHTDGTFVGRAAPEIDIFEGQVRATDLIGEVSQSAQWAPFNARYVWNDTPENMMIANPTISTQNTYVGGTTQQATSVITRTDMNCYELGGTGCFSVYGFEYKPGFDNAYIAWISNNQLAWTMMAGGMGPDNIVQISTRPIPQEPMVRVSLVYKPKPRSDLTETVHSSISSLTWVCRSFGAVDLADLPFPVHMRVDYIRVYQPENAINIGCDPPDFPTARYIKKYVTLRTGELEYLPLTAPSHIEAYTNPNLTTWVDDYQQPWPRNSLIDRC